jgi:hypothetical protein
MPKKPNGTYSAPVACVDWPYDDDVIWPCPECLPWHLEIVKDPKTGDTTVREWHAAESPMLVEILKGSDG